MLETEFKVLTTLKGQRAEVIRLKHYRIDVAQVPGGLINAGTELSFEADTKSKVAYLLFLRVSDGGRFEPLSGHTFPDETVFRLNTHYAR